MPMRVPFCFFEILSHILGVMRNAFCEFGEPTRSSYTISLHTHPLHCVNRSAESPDLEKKSYSVIDGPNYWHRYF